MENVRGKKRGYDKGSAMYDTGNAKHGKGGVFTGKKFAKS
jgi:hypothetical protein